MSDLIRLENVSYHYNSKKILHDINLSVSIGDVIFITGRSGNGKSTLLELVAGLLTPSQGLIFWQEKPLLSYSDQEMTILRRRMGYVFQSHALISNLTIFENVALPLRYHLNLSDSQLSSKVLEHLDMFQIRPFSSYLPESLSQGQRQWTALARALIMNPDILILDEPTSDLDTRDFNTFISLLKMWQKSKPLTIVMTSNNSYVIKTMGGSLILLEQGNLLNLEIRDGDNTHELENSMD